MNAVESSPVWLQWVAALSPAATFLVALLAAAVAWRTLGQRTLADARSHWWDRTRWAVERAQSPQPLVRDVGILTLALQATSSLARDEEIALLDAIWEPIVGPSAQDVARDRESALEYDVLQHGRTKGVPTMSVSSSPPSANESAMRGTVVERINSSGSNRVPVTTTEVAAAKLRVAADKRLGRTTPLWVRKLAEAK